MELDQNLDELRKQGLGLAAVSYDSEAILKNFAERRKIRFPLLSDADSRAIRAFGILNENAKKDTLFYGIPHPVTFVTDREGLVKTKYFEEDYRERQTLSGLLAKDYAVAPTAARGSVEAKHVKVSTSASTAIIHTGQRVLLAVDVE
ncbi:MAG TPA: redoxin domain-containing protein, partial [Bryobacteraceae bacterium]|nr:redoxin domain-containing protein [Bryobacteraceae bacterium]